MTREEAIKTWLPIISMGVDNMPELKEALDMAIKALEQGPKSEWEQDHAILKAYSDGSSDVLDKIRAEIESNMESIIGKYDSSIPKSNMPSYKIERNKVRKECISIIDKYKAGSEVSDADSN